jgi:hypothetical protein
MFSLQQSREWLSRYRKRASLHSTGISLACPAKVKPQPLHEVAKPSATRCATELRPGTRDFRCKSSVAFCPHCYALITVGDARCPICGADWYARSYAARLFLAWNHPLADVRMRATIALGLRRERLAGQPLVECASYGILRTSSRAWRSSTACACFASMLQGTSGCQSSLIRILEGPLGGQRSVLSETRPM